MNYFKASHVLTERRLDDATAKYRKHYCAYRINNTSLHVANLQAKPAALVLLLLAVS